VSEFLRGMAAPFLWVWQLVGPYRFGVAVSVLIVFGVGWLIVSRIGAGGGGDAEGE